MVIPVQLKPALQGVYPSHIVTASKEGIPNIASLSQVWYVDERHVALSHQFFRKTLVNVSENPYAVVKVLEPESFIYWELVVKFSHIVTEGPIFLQMKLKLDAIASLLKQSVHFELKSAHIYSVISCRECLEDWEESS